MHGYGGVEQLFYEDAEEPLKPGETILIIGVGGGVASASLKFYEPLTNQADRQPRLSAERRLQLNGISKRLSNSARSSCEFQTEARRLCIFGLPITSRLLSPYGFFI